MPGFSMLHKNKTIIILLVLLVLLISGFISGFFIPQKLTMPVLGATKADYHPESFWYYPWGRSVTHKGVDIFAPAGTPVVSATCGIVIFKGYRLMGGNAIMILGPKWRIHYYAHLKDIHVQLFQYVHSGQQIGTVGNTGNAINTPPHLHYSIITIIPYPWQIDNSPQGWKKMFYINPIPYLENEE